ncbi:ComEC/Rec2 family competence protein [Nocardioides rotundus]|uniref:ComEC/Rec2 family competence protein n=1 Tax=Nocardioides rotundus TaxID=1774216 RepID=UPI001CBFB0C1|nr:ComEC/Rec2 family competence protein [Nocardioides rotundus]
MRPEDADAAADLRMPALGAAAWLAALAVLQGPPWAAPLLAVPLLLALFWAVRRGRGAATVLAVLVAAAGAATVAGLQVARSESGPVAALARDEATIRGTLTITSDPRRVTGTYADLVVVRGTLREVHGRGRSWRVRTPVVVLADPGWSGLELGESVALAGRLAPADGDATALVLARGPAETVARPDVWWRAAAAVRASLRESVDGRPAAQRALVPALVVGDDSRVGEELATDFRTTGLTHLLAVSGTNLTLLVGFLLVLARWCGVRGRWLHVVGAAGIVGFILLARTEPSVVRAAAMGTVGLVGMGRNGLRRGTRGLGVAVVCLLLVDPWLAVSPGFALSVLATAGILLLAPAWRDAMARWMPRWLAEAVAVPAAAQLACTPVVAVLSGEVSLVAVAANLLAAPAVGPATVLGLVGGLVGLVWPWLASVVGIGAGWCVGWIALVADLGAGLPTASIAWGTGPVSVAFLCGLCFLLARLAPRLLRHRTSGLACLSLMVLLVLIRPPTPTWPPEDWVVAACDVGQGDAVVLRAAPGQVVVVDTGPEPAPLADCLRRLDVRAVPLLVLSHFHADHVGGLAGVLGEYDVGAALVSPLAEPAGEAAEARAALAGRGVAVRAPAVGERLQVGEVSLEVLGPEGGSAATAGSTDGEGSAANDASVVLLARVRGVRILLTGDIEPPAQADLLRRHPGLRADVLKTPHHGSRYQDLDLLLGLRARVVLTSVGADNDYGHPAPETLRPLGATGATLLRTDRGGDLLVLEDDGRLLVRTRE